MCQLDFRFLSVREAGQALAFYERLTLIGDMAQDARGVAHQSDRLFRVVNGRHPRVDSWLDQFDLCTTARKGASQDRELRLVAPSDPPSAAVADAGESALLTPR